MGRLAHPPRHCLESGCLGPVDQSLHSRTRKPFQAALSKEQFQSRGEHGMDHPVLICACTPGCGDLESWATFHPVADAFSSALVLQQPPGDTSNSSQC